MNDATNAEAHHYKVENYYRFHSRIYDATRWSFLFGRDAMLNMIPDLPSQPRIMEVGCGTGKNIERLQYYFPDAEMLGLDLSQDMLNIACEKVENTDRISFKKTRYGSQQLDEKPFDLILLSYSLTMVGHQVEGMLHQIAHDLKPKGYIAVVDFHTSPFGWFRNWMGMNHVDLSGRMLPLLNNYFRPTKKEIHKAYLGAWSYFHFLGQK